MKRFLKKALRWAAILLATLVVLLLVFYAEEDWRGARDWAACQKDLAAKGETLDLRQLAPPGNPKDDLSKVPIFAELYLDNQDFEKTKRFNDTLRLYHLNPGLGLSDNPKTANYFKGELIDLAAWQKFYRSTSKANLPQKIGTPAEDVLQALSQFAPEINEIDAALSNPNAYWPVNYERPFDTFLGGVTRMIYVAKVLQLRAVAHLDNHETDLAEKDFLFSFRLNHPLAQRCFLINYLVMIGVRTIDNSILWEGLHRHAWTDSQLQEMESALASEDVLALAPKAFRTERASGVKTMEFVQGQGPSVFRNLGDYDEEGIEALCNTWYFRPKGWWSQDRRHYAFGIQNLIIAINLSQKTLSPDAFKIKDPTTWQELYTPLANTMLSANSPTGLKVAQAETYRRLARLACRLEEYRIAHAQYPDTLDALPDLPAHLNQEVLNETPFHYQRKGDGYSLYSLGWDQKDDGGKAANPISGTSGDWPWPSP